MDEWQKICVATLAGFVGGTLSEPFKQVLKDYFVRRRIRAAVRHAARALYWELTAVVMRKPIPQLLYPPYDELRFYLDKEAGLLWSVRGGREIKMLLKKLDLAESIEGHAAFELLQDLVFLATSTLPPVFGGWLKRRVRKELPEIKKAVKDLLPDAMAKA